MPPFSKHLTDAELERLEDFLRYINPDEAMTLEEMDGFFCALICGSEVVSPSEYLPHVWGCELTEGRGFESIEQAQDIMTLITRHWNHIAATLLRDEPYPVLMGEYEDGGVTGHEWAMGFERGVYLRQGSWAGLASDKEFGEALLPVILLAENPDGEPDGLRLGSAPVTHEEREAMLDMLADSVLLIYRYFRGKVTPRGKETRKTLRSDTT